MPTSETGDFSVHLEKNDITSTRHILPFRNLSSDDFERLCFWVVERSSQFDSVEHYGMTGDKKRDVIGYKHSKEGTREQWYFQCKRYKEISFSNFKDELKEIKKHSDEKNVFKPDVIVFVTACPVSPSCKDDVSAYARELSLDIVYFWTDFELDEKAKAIDGVVREFFGGGFIATDIADIKEGVVHGVVEALKQSSPVFFQQTGLIAGSFKIDEVNKEIDEAVQLLQGDKIEDAKCLLLEILGKIKDKSDYYGYESARIYNNLGVCFNRSRAEGGDFDKAEAYFNLALKSKPDFIKAKANLVSVYYSKGGEDNFKKAYDIAHPLWDASDKKDLLLLVMFIWSMYYYKSAKDVVEYYEHSEEAKSLANHNEPLLQLMGMMYFDAQDLKKAEELAESALEISPDSPQNLSLKASILMARSQKEAIIPSDLDVVPRFRDYQDIEMAQRLLDQALESLGNENNPSLETKIKNDLFLCSLWLRRAKEAKYRDIRTSIDLARLEPHQRQQLRIQDFAVELQARNFESAYTMLVESPDWSKTDYEEKVRVAYIFFLRGAPQYSNDILKPLEAEAEQRKDIRFWLCMSLNEVLLDNKHLTIKAAQKAKELSKGTSMEKEALSHFNALMLRYAASGEVDRLMEGLFDYNKRFPDDRIIRQVKALDDEGQITEEMKSTLLKQKERYEGIRETFRSQFIPSYFLEKVFDRPYADILSSQNDPEFIIELTIANEQFEKDLLENLASTESLVLDYAVLLNLAKMNLLGHLARLKKKFYIAESLFNKVQNELLMFEQEDLRRVWNFLKSSKQIKIEEESKTEFEYENILEIFGKWGVDSIYIAKQKNALLVTDDLRFMQLLSTESIKSCNSPIILKFMLEKKWIDEKIYSTSIGDLAERFYTFLCFTGDDLFLIAMEDDAKITLRSYHLVNQLFLPGSVATSFTGVFVRFIDLLWKTGSLPENKMQWLTFLTSKVLAFIDKQGGVQYEEELETVAPDFVKMWVIAVQNSNKDEIILMQKGIETVLNKSYLDIFKRNISQLIEAKKLTFMKQKNFV